MCDVVSLQQGCQDLACTDRVGFEGNEDKNRCRLRVMASEEVVIELRYQGSGEIHRGEDQVEVVEGRVECLHLLDESHCMCCCVVGRDIIRSRAI